MSTPERQRWESLLGNVRAYEQKGFAVIVQNMLEVQSRSQRGEKFEGWELSLRVIKLLVGATRDQGNHSATPDPMHTAAGLLSCISEEAVDLQLAAAAMSALAALQPSLSAGFDSVLVVFALVGRLAMRHDHAVVAATAGALRPNTLASLVNSSLVCYSNADSAQAVVIGSIVGAAATSCAKLLSGSDQPTMAQLHEAARLLCATAILDSNDRAADTWLLRQSELLAVVQHLCAWSAAASPVATSGLDLANHKEAMCMCLRAVHLHCECCLDRGCSDFVLSVLSHVMGMLAATDPRLIASCTHWALDLLRAASHIRSGGADEAFATAVSATRGAFDRLLDEQWQQGVEVVQAETLAERNGSAEHAAAPLPQPSSAGAVLEQLVKRHKQRVGGSVQNAFPLRLRLQHVLALLPPVTWALCWLLRDKRAARDRQECLTGVAAAMPQIGTVCGQRQLATAELRVLAPPLLPALPPLHQQDLIPEPVVNVHAYLGIGCAHMVALLIPAARQGAASLGRHPAAEADSLAAAAARLEACVTAVADWLAMPLTVLHDGKNASAHADTLTIAPQLHTECLDAAFAMLIVAEAVLEHAAGASATPVGLVVSCIRAMVGVLRLGTGFIQQEFQMDYRTENEKARPWLQAPLKLLPQLLALLPPGGSPHLSLHSTYIRDAITSRLQELAEDDRAPWCGTWGNQMRQVYMSLAAAAAHVTEVKQQLLLADSEHSWPRIQAAVAAKLKRSELKLLQPAIERVNAALGDASRGEGEPKQQSKADPAAAAAAADAIAEQIIAAEEGRQQDDAAPATSKRARKKARQRAARSISATGAPSSVDAVVTQSLEHSCNVTAQPPKPQGATAGSCTGGSGSAYASADVTAAAVQEASGNGSLGGGGSGGGGGQPAQQSPDAAAAPSCAADQLQPDSATPAPSVPAWSLCPISQEPMRDPVLYADGQSYERAAIEIWLATHETSPLTGAVLEHKGLLPNHALRNLIQGMLGRRTG